MHYQVIHHTPGRLRVRCGRGMFNHDQACGIECRLLKLKGVSSVKATPCNGGVHPVRRGESPDHFPRAGQAQAGNAPQP